MQLYIIQALNNQSTLIVQSIIPKNLRIRRYVSIISCLIHYFDQDQMPLLMSVIQCKIWVRPGYFINQVRPTGPGPNVTWVTQMTQPVSTLFWIRLYWHCITGIWWGINNEWTMFKSATSHPKCHTNKHI